MGFDVRIPIGLLLSCIGAVLAGYGLASDPETCRRALGMNVDLWWGLVLVAIGGTLLAFARRARARNARC